jgi:transcriptional regulator with XRE-family HTH domain
MPRLPGTVRREIGVRFRVLRLREGWSGPELARRAGVAANTPYRLETGKNVTLENLLRIAAVLGALEGFDSVGMEALEMRSIEEALAPVRRRAPRRKRLPG